MMANDEGILSVKYFESYFKLIISSRNIGVEEAKQFIESNFFQGNPQLYGATTYQSYLTASEHLKNKNYMHA